MTSRGEGGIDLLVHQRFFHETKSGVFIDVGAARPDFLSMSALFRANGWDVVVVEPNPHFCELHRQAGHEVLQYACADYDADDVSFSIVDSHGENYRDGQVSFESFSSISVKDSYRRLRPDLPMREIRVNVRKLDTLLREHAPHIDRIDVLSIDVEGWELEVVRGLSLDVYQPKVIIVENFLDDVAYSKFMRSHGYVLWKRAAPNDVYVRASTISWPHRLMLRFYTTVVEVIRRGRSVLTRTALWLRDSPN